MKWERKLAYWIYIASHSTWAVAGILFICILIKYAKWIAQ